MITPTIITIVITGDVTHIDFKFENLFYREV